MAPWIQVSRYGNETAVHSLLQKVKLKFTTHWHDFRHYYLFLKRYNSLRWIPNAAALSWPCEYLPDVVNHTFIYIFLFQFLAHDRQSSFMLNCKISYVELRDSAKKLFLIVMGNHTWILNCISSMKGRFITGFLAHTSQSNKWIVLSLDIFGIICCLSGLKRFY